MTWAGAWITPLVGFLFIGLDLTARDRLHDAWSRRGLVWKMAALIAAGSILSWILNRNAGRVAIASFIAFGAAGSIDALVYHLLRRRSRFERINWSNLASAAIDSILFPAIAFGWPPDLTIVYGMSTAKIAGGLFWSLVLGSAAAGRELADGPPARAAPPTWSPDWSTCSWAGAHLNSDPPPAGPKSPKNRPHIAPTKPRRPQC